MKAIPISATINYNGVFYAPGQDFVINKKDAAYLSKYCEIIEDENSPRSTEENNTPAPTSEDPVIVSKTRVGRPKKSQD